MGVIKRHNEIQFIRCFNWWWTTFVYRCNRDIVSIGGQQDGNLSPLAVWWCIPFPLWQYGGVYSFTFVVRLFVLSSSNFFSFVCVHVRSSINTYVYFYKWFSYRIVYRIVSCSAAQNIHTPRSWKLTSTPLIPWLTLVATFTVWRPSYVSYIFNVS